MYTKIEDIKTGTVTGYRTQQYEVGTYLIINDYPSKQTGLDVKEADFHKTIRADKANKILEKY